MANGKLKKLVKKGLKKGIKLAKERAVDEAVGAVKGEIRSRSRAQSRRYSKPAPKVGIPRELQPDITLGKKFELKGDRKKRKAKKKINRWKAEAAAGKKSEQQKFLDLDKKIKNARKS